MGPSTVDSGRRRTPRGAWTLAWAALAMGIAVSGCGAALEDEPPDGITDETGDHEDVEAATYALTQAQRIDRSLDFSKGFGASLRECSDGTCAKGSGEQLFLQPAVGLPPCRSIAGGYEAPTHYARVRLRHATYGDPELRLGDTFWVYGDFYLPSDFYAKKQSFMRLITLDNWGQDPALTKTWRLGFLLYGGDHRPRLQRMINGLDEESRTLVTLASKALPAGKTFRVVVKLRLSQVDGSASSVVYIDGVKRGASTLANVSPGLLPDGITAPMYLRARFGFDGAADQDGGLVAMRIGRIGLSVTKPAMLP